MTSEEVISELCARVVAAKDTEAFKLALAELRIAIRDHIENAENLGIHLILKAPKPNALKNGTEG